MKNHLIALRIPKNLLEWIDEIADRDDISRSEVIRRSIQIAKDAKEGQLRFVEPEAEEIYLDKETLNLLADIAIMAGLEESPDRLVRRIITSFHVLLKKGVWGILKPIPELAKTILEEREEV